MPTDEQYEELRRLIASLTERVYRLERGMGLQEADKREKTTRSTEGSSTRPNIRPQPDLESKIGGQWLNRVGIVAVLIGVSYFLRYAFENEWIGPAGRVVIGLLAGIAVLIWSEYVRQRGYAIFSYSLKAIGLGVLYLSLWASSQVYHLVPNALALVAMVIVSAATVAMALWQDAEVIAAFAALGAFITPFALSTGENNAAGLFSYIALLDVVALILIFYRPWMRVLIGSFIATLMLYSTWHVNFYSRDQFSTALASLSAVFAIFAVTPFVNQRERDSSLVIVLALMNAAAYFFEVWELFLHEAATRQSAAAAAALGCLYFLMATLLGVRSTEAMAQVHSAIAAALLVVAVPLGFDAQWMTMGWVVVGAALIEVSERTRNQTIRLLGGIALALGTGRALVLDRFQVTQILLNERMMVCIVVIAALAFAASRWTEAAAFLIVAINVVALISLNREIADAFHGIVRDFVYSALWMIYGAGLMAAGFWKSSRFLRWQALILIGITIAKVFLYDTSSLDRGYRILSLIALGLLLLVTSFLYQRDWFKIRNTG